jgi:hypothetical protein
MRDYDGIFFKELRGKKMKNLIRIAASSREVRTCPLPIQVRNSLLGQPAQR